MLLLFNKKLSTDKRLDITIRKYFGIGKKKSNLIFAKLGLNFKRNKKYYNDFIFNNNNLTILLTELILKNFRFKVESNLINNLYILKKEILKSKTYRALRHSQNLPVRGQRSKNNAKTQKKKNKNLKRLPVAKKKK